MKRRLLYLLPLAAIFLSLISTSIPLVASANAPTDGPRANITLTGTSTPQSYSVKGTLGTSTNIKFSYDSAQKIWYSEKIPGVGQGCANNTIKATNDLHVSISISGKSAADPFVMNFCDHGSNIIPKSVAVTSAQGAADPATFSGKVTYKDDNDKSQPVQSSATGLLKSDSHTYNLTFDDNGNIHKIDVAPGTYTLTVDYAVPGGQNQNYTKDNIVIRAGQDFVLTGAVAGNSANGNSTGSDPNGGGTGPTSPSCEATGEPFNAAWALCPIFNMVAGASDFLFKEIVSPLLTTSPLSTDSSDPMYQAWSNFRIYGNIFLVIALLVVVFGQGIGGGIIEPYTAKKVLPRLVIATILINLSIYIVAGLVDITNIIGGSLGTVITAPLKDAGAFKITPSGVQSDLVFAGTAAAGIGAWLIGVVFIPANSAFFSHATLFIGLFIAMPVILGLLAAFITLILRQALILALVLVSPVAFALYCLPNTQQYFRRWWDLLLQTLIVYPIVIVFFAVSDVLSVTVLR
ncbi:MAG TPA: hypothetical protein VF401_03675 [Candidatus Saccharimonadales bacterium]